MILRPTARLPVNDSLSDHRVADQRVAGRLTGAGHDVEHPGREPGLLDQGGQAQHGERRVLRRLEHDGAAGGQGRGDLLGEQQQRRVPRDHRADHADRLAQGEDHVVAALVGRQRLAGQLVDPAGVMVEDVGHEGRRGGVDGPEAQRDAVVQRLQLQQLVAVLADQVGDPAQHPDPLAGPGPRPRPLVEGPARGAHRQVHVTGPAAIGNEATSSPVAGWTWLQVWPSWAAVHFPSISRRPSDRPISSRCGLMDATIANPLNRTCSTSLGIVHRTAPRRPGTHAPLAAAVQGQGRSADVGRQRGGQEQAGGRDVLGRGHPPERHGPRAAAIPAAAPWPAAGGSPIVSGGGLGRDQAGHDAVDPDLRRPLHREAGGQVVQAGLGRPVGGGPRRRPGAADAADHEDRPAARLALHHLVGGLGDVQRRDQVQLDDLGVKSRGRGGGRRGRGSARVADQHVDPAEKADSRLG